MTKHTHIPVGAWPLRWTKAVGADLRDDVVAGGAGGPQFEQYARSMVAFEATQSGALGLDQLGSLITNVVKFPFWLVATLMLTVARLLRLAPWSVVTVDQRGQRSVEKIRGLRAARAVASSTVRAVEAPAIG